MPWNLHEPERGVFDFGDGERELSPFLNLTRFLEMAKEEDLFVVFRPGRKINIIRLFFRKHDQVSFILRDQIIKMGGKAQSYSGAI